MNCKGYRSRSIEHARVRADSTPPDPALAAHLEVCAECRRFADAQSSLSSAFSLLAAENASSQPPKDLELRVLGVFDAEFGTTAQQRLRQHRWWLLITSAALAASVFAILLIHRPVPTSQTPEVSNGQPFVEIPYVLPPAPYERTQVMRMDVPIAALIAAGFDVHVADVGGSVRADVLFGQDGRAVAIRLISSSVPDIQRRMNP
jgi:hypothetical protein